MHNTTLMGWQKRVIESVTPTVASFADARKGVLLRDDNGLCVRVPVAGGIITVQVIPRGKTDDPKLEVTGVRRSGLETSRTVFSAKDNEPIDLTTFRSALTQALGLGTVEIGEVGCGSTRE